MILNLFYLQAVFKQLILHKGLVFLRLATVLFFIFFSTNLFGQAKRDSIKPQPIISVKNGAAIFSLDESFNKQALNKNVIVDGKTTVKNNTKNGNSVIIKSVPQISNVDTSIKQAVEKAEKQKRKESVEKVKKHLDSIQKGKVNEVVLYPTSDKNFAGRKILQDYLFVSFNNNDHKEIGWYQAIYTKVVSLDFLDVFKANYFNAQSLGYLIIGYLSVRPPPFASFF